MVYQRGSSVPHSLQYEPGEYLVDLLMTRRQRTLLVEGLDDLRTMERISIQLRNGSRTADVIIDSAEMISSPPPDVLSNRQKVEFVNALALAYGVPLVALVDRDYDDFDLLPSFRDKRPQFVILGNTLIKTRGHSLECHLLNAHQLVEYLELMHSDDLRFNVRPIVAKHLRRMVRIAAAISLAAYDTSSLDRLTGAFSDDSWHVGASVALRPDWLLKVFSDRGMTQLRANTFLHYFAEHQRSLAAASVSGRWVIHGHFLFDLIWSMVGALMHKSGAAHSRAIATGQKVLKRKLADHYFAKSLLTRPGGLPIVLRNILA